MTLVRDRLVNFQKRKKKYMARKVEELVSPKPEEG